MPDQIRWGVMATVGDISSVRKLDADFIELLVRTDDSLEQLEAVLEQADQEMIVHAPERMKLDGEARLIDLADASLSRRRAYLQRISEVVALADLYDVPTVVHPGGVHRQDVSNREALKRNLIGSLGELEGRVWIENMPRGYHQGDELLKPQLLIHPQEFDDVVPVVDGITLDICHAYLSVDKGGNRAIASFFERLKGSIKHIHLSDARYPHGEGLPLGEGDIDMCTLPRMRGLPVLLEVWGGHLNDMSGHRRALETARRSEWFRGCVP